MSSLRKVSCIAAMDLECGIGKDGKLPWHIREEFKYFENITTTVKCETKQNAVIMGRTTYFSIPEKFRPLRNRFNIVLSKTLKPSDLPDNVRLEPDLVSSVKTLSCEPYVDKIEKIFVTGGAGVYKEAMESAFCERIYLTKIENAYSCDVFFPRFDTSVYKEITLEEVPQGEQKCKDIIYRFHVYSTEE